MLWPQLALTNGQIVLEQRLRNLQVFLTHMQESQCSSDRGCFQGVCSQVLLVNVESLSSQGFAFLIEPLRFIEARQPM